MNLKPYRTIPIHECGEPLRAITPGALALFDPAPYMACGAPYRGASPWMLRETVLEKLIEAQRLLQETHPKWSIKIFDAYRPNDVQDFMVEREYMLLAAKAGLDYARLTTEQRNDLMPQVLRIWAIPSEDPATPPPHSTGAVFDCTLIDENGNAVDMGGELDENSDRSFPDYYANATSTEEQQFHANRQILAQALTSQGFCRNLIEWWHFSIGDQYWAWQERETGRNPEAFARYGRADLINS